jgi:sugar phosphate isomerase/epimerase
LKIVLQLGLIPGDSTLEKVTWARDTGVDGIELGAWGGIDQLRRDADICQNILPVTSICGNCDDTGAGSFDFLDPDPIKRRKSLDGSAAILELCGELKAIGQVIPPIFGPARVPDLSPFASALELEHGLMTAMLHELGPIAAAHNTLVLLEPLNRYEQHYLRKLSDGIAAIERAGTPPGVALLADTFHMHIEETDSPQSILNAADIIKHVHVADNTRFEPGSGDIDFTAIIKALRSTGYDGHLAYECSISGDSATEKQHALARSIAYLKAAIDQES